MESKIISADNVRRIYSFYCKERYLKYYDENLKEILEELEDDFNDWVRIQINCHRKCERYSGDLCD